jgi:hypothetical protein
MCATLSRINIVCCTWKQEDYGSEDDVCLCDLLQSNERVNTRYYVSDSDLLFDQHPPDDTGMHTFIQKRYCRCCEYEFRDWRLDAFDKARLMWGKKAN